MSGTIKWTATFIGSGSPMAELYDKNGKVVMSKPIPCVPPIACPFPMEDLELTTYTAALAIGRDRYYYCQEVPIVTKPNDATHATRLELSETNPEIEIAIHVEA